VFVNPRKPLRCIRSGQRGRATAGDTEAARLPIAEARGVGGAFLLEIGARNEKPLVVAYTRGDEALNRDDPLAVFAGVGDAIRVNLAGEASDRFGERGRAEKVHDDADLANFSGRAWHERHGVESGLFFVC
jgi:hypothetical protein